MGRASGDPVREGSFRDQALVSQIHCLVIIRRSVLTENRRFIEEPTAPDDILGHAAIRRALKPYGIGVATGEHAHNRMVFKQLLQADAIDVCQIDSCRLAGVSEVLSVLLLAAKYVKGSALQCISRLVSLSWFVLDSECRYVHTQVELDSVNT